MSSPPSSARRTALATVSLASSVDEGPIFLGLECGGTRSVALAVKGTFLEGKRSEAGPCNLRLVTDDQLEARFREVTRGLPEPSAIGVGMAGVRDAQDCARIERVLERIWPSAPRRVDHDLESALFAAEMEATSPQVAARVIVLSGTGSCCYGRNRAGRVAKVGGWGHHLGDRGSGYDIARTAFRLMARNYDHSGRLGDFGRHALRQLLLNEPNDLIAWFQDASKADVAALTPAVFATAGNDPSAAAALQVAHDELVLDALACAAQLAGTRENVEFVFAGSVLLKQSGFSNRVGVSILKKQRGKFRPLGRESVWGAVAMARNAWEACGGSGDTSQARLRKPRLERQAPRSLAGPIPASTRLSPTEARNERSRNLHRMPLAAAIDLMLSEDATVPPALGEHRGKLARLVNMAVCAFKSGGRLFYVGAGTSGRLGVLDASECPPTFRTPPNQVQGIIAGGEPALHSAVEGAEDDFEAGTRVMEFRNVGPSDLIVGLAASGRTPFVWGALTAARRRRSKTALLCFNPYLQFAPGQKPDLVLAVNVGPEVLTGSTRLKAGTATKLVLNMITTLAMVRLGKVVGNLMVDLNPSNKKLRDRACRIVQELTACSASEANATLERSAWVVTKAIRLVGGRKPSRKRRGNQRGR
ncbi:MAG TPA: N-acetylmuramic acid 6-phosphate etherase [Verrucomicrobiota bacterium]|nr:N-acetylmuramic acid 6-phosphate etherase [Verrucomicrobiota bacterium]